MALSVHFFTPFCPFTGTMCLCTSFASVCRPRRCMCPPSRGPSPWVCSAFVLQRECRPASLRTQPLCRGSSHPPPAQARHPKLRPRVPDARPEQACQADRRWRDEALLLNGVFSVNVGLTGNELEMPVPTVGAGRVCLRRECVIPGCPEGWCTDRWHGGGRAPGSPLAASLRRVHSKGFDLQTPGFPWAASLRPVLLSPEVGLVLAKSSHQCLQASSSVKWPPPNRRISFKVAGQAL